MKMGQPDEDPTAPDTRVVSLLTKLARSQMANFIQESALAMLERTA